MVSSIKLWISDATHYDYYVLPKRGSKNIAIRCPPVCPSVRPSVCLFSVSSAVAYIGTRHA